MDYIFSVEDAVKYGVKEAIILNHFKYWIFRNKIVNKNYIDNQFWTVANDILLEKMFPFFDKQTIKQTIKSMEEQKIIIKRQIKDKTIYAIMPGIDIEEVPSLQSHKKRERKLFVKPTKEEVKAYIEENKYDVDVGKFYDHYESNGWKVSKNPMKDWQATVRNWDRAKTDKTKNKNRNEFLEMLKKEKENNGE